MRINHLCRSAFTPWISCLEAHRSSLRGRLSNLSHDTAETILWLSTCWLRQLHLLDVAWQVEVDFRPESFGHLKWFLFSNAVPIRHILIQFHVVETDSWNAAPDSLPDTWKGPVGPLPVSDLRNHFELHILKSLKCKVNFNLTHSLITLDCHSFSLWWDRIASSNRGPSVRVSESGSCEALQISRSVGTTVCNRHRLINSADEVDRSQASPQAYRRTTEDIRARIVQPLTMLC